RAYPTIFVIVLLNTGIVYLAQFFRFFGSLGSLLFMLAFLGGLYFLVFAPVGAIRQGLGPRESARRSVAAARLPGSRHVALVMLYFLLSFVPFLYSLPGPFMANPTIRQWSIVLGMTIVHVVFAVAFVYRYISVEDQIPDAA